MLRNPSRLMRAPPVAPHAKGGTYLGGRTASKTLAPVPTTVPVASSVPIAVLAWSPMRLPNNWRPVSSGVPATSSRTRPYVFFRFDVIVPAPRFAQRPITEWPTKPSWALLAYPRNTQFDTSPRTLQRGPIAVTRTEPPRTWALAPTHTGPSSRVPERTSAPLSSTTGPPRTSNTTPGSTTASRRAIALGSPSTVLPAGIGSASPSSARRSAWSSRSSVAITLYTPRSTAPATSIVRACGCGRSHVAPGPPPQPTVMPPQVSRNTPSGSAGASPQGAKVEDPMTAGPGTRRPGGPARGPRPAEPARGGTGQGPAAPPPPARPP